MPAMPADPTDVFADRPPPRGPRYRSLVVLLLASAAGLGALWYAAGGRFGGGGRNEPPESFDTDRYLYAPTTAADPSTGEEVAPFTGFAVSVDTDPADGIVTIAGVPRGEAPVLAGVECAPGAKVKIRAEKAGFRPADATTTCRADSLVKLTVRLSP
jgi:hypothetical protein